MADVKVFATVKSLEDDPNNGSFYRVAYRLSEPVGTPPHIDGEVQVHFDPNMTETETNAAIQAAVAARADLESGGSQGFTVNDVRGGRI